MHALHFHFVVFQSSKEACWLYEDHEGRKHGPHSLLELFSWHQYGYLRDSTMVSCELIVCTYIRSPISSARNE